MRPAMTSARRTTHQTRAVVWLCRETGRIGSGETYSCCRLARPAVAGLGVVAAQPVRPSRRARTPRQPTGSGGEPARPGQATRFRSAASITRKARREASGNAAATGGPAATTTRQPVLASWQISLPGPCAGFPLSARLGLSTLVHRSATARSVPGTRLLLRRMGGDRPATATTRVRLGALWSRPPAGQPQHGSSLRRRVRRVLLAPNVVRY